MNFFVVEFHGIISFYFFGLVNLYIVPVTVVNFYQEIYPNTYTAAATI